ncbi:Uma2 family endonuclease [Crocosphaera sp. XPORK-15E]|uniref:Uma2 family endonuclease n=1 Tax=Crocosphaera sp. XPORK-15E TaxID=3110247 RepID=UPI002B21A6B4|nr:Uma2 family endonuclease [Crocosphaera sp. XPORK-15E]MEA5533959.1 Uma2 family endonuclease [Crocosphaera sp. XPORK-15E]
MTTTSILTLSLEDFLEKPNIDESPAWEYINAKMSQKPMPQGQHSKLQYKLCETINQVAESPQIAYALPELRCSFGNRSIVPDISIFYWKRIPTTADGEIANQFNSFPDWTIEILSPKQNSTKVIDNILHCLEYGSQLGWLIDPDERSILVFQPQQTPKIYKSNLPENETVRPTLPILDTIDLRITAEQIFGWLKMKP